MTATPPALQAQRTTLSSGTAVLHSYAAANPSVVVRALVRAGASREVTGLEGLASFVGRMLRQGTEAIGKEALAEELDGMGAGLSIDVGYSLAAVSIKCLSADFERATQILGQVLRHPAFPEQEIERVRGQALTDLREIEDDTRVMAEQAWRRMAYPPSHPYHRLTTGTEESLRGIGRGHLETFHRTWYGPNQATFVVVGDVEAAQAHEALEGVVAGWPSAAETPVEESLPASDLPSAATQQVALSGKTQADVVMGTTTLDRKSADYYALAFANHIMGRMYFMGRLGEKVRDEQGLAYYAYSDLQAGFGRGPWVVRAGVNPRNVEKALSSIQVELRRFLAEGPTEQEQADAVSSLLGSLPRQLETNEGAAAVLGEIEIYDLGLDYLDRYPGIIRSLTREQVTETARRWLKPETMVTAVAGPPL